jgi:hypothetical protein
MQEIVLSEANNLAAERIVRVDVGKRLNESARQSLNSGDSDAHPQGGGGQNDGTRRHLTVVIPASGTDGLIGP